MLKGTITLIIATLLFAIAHSTVKFLGSDLSIFQLSFLRFIVAPIVLLPFIKCGSFKFSIDNWSLIVLRTFFGVSATLLYFVALIDGSPGQVSLIFQCSALWSSIYACVYYKERIHWISMVMIPIAFVGLFLIIKPSSSDLLSNSNLIALCASFMNAGVFLTLKKLRDTNNSQSVLLANYSLSSLVLLAPVTVSPLPAPNTTIILGALVIAAFGFTGNWFMTIGFKYSTASLSGMIMLLTVPWMFLSGVLFFNEQITVLTGIGSLMVLMAIMGMIWKK